jgi:hypothetical protein
MGTVRPSRRNPESTPVCISCAGNVTLSAVFDKVIGLPRWGPGDASDDNVADIGADPEGASGGLRVVVHEFTAVAEPEPVAGAAAPALVAGHDDAARQTVSTATPSSRGRTARTDGPRLNGEPPLQPSPGCESFNVPASILHRQRGRYLCVHTDDCPSPMGAVHPYSARLRRGRGRCAPYHHRESLMAVPERSTPRSGLWGNRWSCRAAMPIRDL